MRRVGLIDITVGNAARLGASQRSTTRRCASHHNSTQPVRRWGGCSGCRAFTPQALKRSSACGSETVWRLRATAVQRAADEIEFALRKDDDNAEGASSSHDHPIETPALERQQMTYFFCKMILPRSDFIQTMTDSESNIMKAHGDYLQSLAEVGSIVCHGPVDDPKGGWGCRSFLQSTKRR